MKLSNSLLDSFIAQAQPGLRGFIRRNLFRMRQFYEVYRHEEKVSALLTQLPWAQNLIILGQSKQYEIVFFQTLKSRLVAGFSGTGLAHFW